MSDTELNKKQNDRLVEIRIINVANSKKKLYNENITELELWWNDYLVNERKKIAYEDGYAEGETIGYSKGETNNRYKIALKMLDANEPIEKINLFTEIPLEELKTMKKNGSTLQKVK